MYFVLEFIARRTFFERADGAVCHGSSHTKIITKKTMKEKEVSIHSELDEHGVILVLQRKIMNFSDFVIGGGKLRLG